MRNVVLWLVLLLACMASTAWAEDPAPPEAGNEPPAEPSPTPLPAAPPPAVPEPLFGVDLVVGFTALPELDYRYKLTRTADECLECRTDDESTLETNGVYGLSLGFYPRSNWAHLGLIVEGLFAQYEGQLTGRADCPSSFTRTYRYDQRLNFYQLNALLKIYFTQKTVRPFVEIGLGVVRVDAEFDTYDQTVYGVTGLTSWGAEWRISRNFGLSLQARLADHFGLVYFYEPQPGDHARIEAQYIPISAVLKTHFYF